MLTLHADLLAAQKSAGNYSPSFSLTLTDNGRPHFSRWLASGAGNNPAPQDCFTLPDGSLLRVQAALGTLYCQVVSDLTSAAQWMAAWSSIGAGFGPQLLMVGGRVLLIYFIQSGSPAAASLCFRYSDNNGSTWSAQAVIQAWTGAGAGTVDISAAGAGIFYAVSSSGVIYFRSYTIAAGWSAAVASADLGCSDLAAVFCGSGIYCLLFGSLIDALPRLKTLVYDASISAYGAARELTNTGSPHYSFSPTKIIYVSSLALYLAFAHVNEEEWHIAGGVSCSSHRVFFSVDAEHWSDPLVVDTPADSHIETAVEGPGAAVYAPANDGGR
jgi:hypothetical protein